MLYITVFWHATVFRALCCKRGICTAWCFLPWQVLSSHIFRGTTSHRCHIQSKTHLRCSSLHSSHREYHRAHPRPLHNSHQVTSDCCFGLIHRLTSVKIKLVAILKFSVKGKKGTKIAKSSPMKRIEVRKARPLHLCAVSGFTSTIHAGFVFNSFPSRRNFK